MPKTESFLSEETRAEDILLGALGYGEGAHIISIQEKNGSFSGHGRFDDGEEFDFESDFELDELDRWALKILAGRR